MLVVIGASTLLLMAGVLYYNHVIALYNEVQELYGSLYARLPDIKAQLSDWNRMLLEKDLPTAEVTAAFDSSRIAMDNHAAGSDLSTAFEQLDQELGNALKSDKTSAAALSREGLQNLRGWKEVFGAYQKAREDYTRARGLVPFISKLANLPN